MIDLTERVQTLWEAEAEQRRTVSPPQRAASRARADFTVQDLPSLERPRERLAAAGPSALSQQELLACLLGRGCAGESVLTTAQRLLNRFGGFHGIAQAPLEELAKVRGVGLAKGCQLKAACEISRRAEIGPPRLTGALDSPTQAAKAARRYLAGRSKEHFIVLLLDARYRVIKVAPVSVGSLQTSVVHPRETFREAISAGAAALILAHNHPSGDPTPSQEDLNLTRRLVKAGRLLGIPVMDHLIVGEGNPFSLKAAGFLGESDARVSPSESV